MRPFRPLPARHSRFANAAGAALAGAALLLALPGDAVVRLTEPEPVHHKTYFGALCRTQVEGSRAFADCHNPYPDTDRLRLHVECARWWDVDSDGAAVAAGPAAGARLDGRCWKEVESVWVSHQK